MHKSFLKLVTLMLMAISVQAQNDIPPDSTKSYGGLLIKPRGKIRAEVSKFFSKDADGNTGAGYKPWTNLVLSGYVRPYVIYRNMSDVYQGYPNQEKKNLSLDGYEISNNPAALNGYQEPFLLLRLEGKPTSKTHFKVEYAMDNQMDGNAKDVNPGPVSGIKQLYTRRVSTYRVFQFTADAFTKYGSFKLVSGGGVNYTRMSPLTLWNYEYRDDMFERYPWEPENRPFSRYNSFYAVQNVARDARWGNTGTQGFILEGKGLPLGFGALIMYGKTDNSGAFQSYVTRTPKNAFAVRVDKGLGANRIGFNYFHQFGYYNTAALYSIHQQIATIDARINLPNVKIFIEAGGGSYVEKGILSGPAFYSYTGNASPNDTATSFENKWAPTASVQFDFTKKATLIPLSLSAYYIDKSVVNVNSQVLNTANNHALGAPENVNSPYDVTTFKGALTDLGQMANNRMGASLKHEDTYGKLKVLLAVSGTQEIQNLYKVYSQAPFNISNNPVNFAGYAQSFNNITFMHRANQFTRSRFGYFQNNFGPYNRITNVYRRTWETISVTDTGDFAKSYRKGFSMAEFNWKYKITLFKRDLIISNYYYYGSVQDHFSPIPTFSNKAFLRSFYQELNAFYAIHPKVSLLAFFSLERNLGNMRTSLADANGATIVDDLNGKIPAYRPDGKPIDQVGHGYGVGLDYDFASRAGIFIRHRWFDHKDHNFTMDHFKGQETQVEFKIFF